MDNDSITCDECDGKRFEVPAENKSDIRYRGIVVGWYIEVEAVNKRSRFNYKKALIRDRYTCQYCGYSPSYCIGDFKPITVDHIHPFKYSGSNRLDNLVACCFECNVMMGAKLFEDFLDKKAYLVERRREKGLPLYFRETRELRDLIENYAALEEEFH